MPAPARIVELDRLKQIDQWLSSATTTDPLTLVGYIVFQVGGDWTGEIILEASYNGGPFAPVESFTANDTAYMYNPVAARFRVWFKTYTDGSARVFLSGQ